MRSFRLETDDPSGPMVLLSPSSDYYSDGADVSPVNAKDTNDHLCALVGVGDGVYLYDPASVSSAKHFSRTSVKDHRLHVGSLNAPNEKITSIAVIATNLGDGSSLLCGVSSGGRALRCQISGSRREANVLSPLGVNTSRVTGTSASSVSLCSFRDGVLMGVGGDDGQLSLLDAWTGATLGSCRTDDAVQATCFQGALLAGVGRRVSLYDWRASAAAAATPQARAGSLRSAPSTLGEARAGGLTATSVASIDAWTLGVGYHDGSLALWDTRKLDAGPISRDPQIHLGRPVTSLHADRATTGEGPGRLVAGDERGVTLLGVQAGFLNSIRTRLDLGSDEAPICATSCARDHVNDLVLGTLEESGEVRLASLASLLEGDRPARAY